MDVFKYKQKINDIIEKCPIEAGVEILVYNLLDECVDDNLYSLVDINSIWKKSDRRLVTESVVPDIAILSKDFVFGNYDKGIAYGFVEVKKPGKSLRETEQIIGEKRYSSHYIYTNGLVWKCYENGNYKEFNLMKKKLPHSLITVEIDEKMFLELIEYLKNIDWMN